MHNSSIVRAIDEFIEEGKADAVIRRYLQGLIGVKNAPNILPEDLAADIFGLLDVIESRAESIEEFTKVNDALYDMNSPALGDTKLVQDNDPFAEETEGA